MNREPLQVRWDLPPSEKAVHDTRHSAEAVLAAWQVDEDQADAALLVMAELAANALRHGKGTDIGVTISLVDQTVMVDVTDGDYRIGAVQPTRHHGWGHTNGRGLQLVTLLAGAWGSYPTPEGKGVWATVPPPKADQADHPPHQLALAAS
ncbi:anti-sigma regulatory factor (Ser/Thr protein kinase) [Streptacidiphilus sp. MAP12-20]|uniref:ATP-binding protein n=1 Tax=Streptacidiphilus sp. MAP12-20 TaxID=3156299 RepID=UPI003519A8D3